ncbi:MAG: hypothetical protein H6882_04505 [Rhodobiaceae bacterium]|nr:hypothetical protein [Rhodobiaceae bacterium]
MRRCAVHWSSRRLARFVEDTRAGTSQPVRLLTSFSRKWERRASRHTRALWRHASCGSRIGSRITEADRRAKRIYVAGLGGDGALSSMRRVAHSSSRRAPTGSTCPATLALLDYEQAPADRQTGFRRAAPQ